MPATMSTDAVPLSPRPDLQLASLQAGNVERLERSAERLSLGSSVLATELRDLDSPSDNVLLRMGDPSSGASVMSAPTRCHGLPLAEPGAPAAVAPTTATTTAAAVAAAAAAQSSPDQDRPSTAASNDTYQQARNLFTDFDGVHFIPNDKVLDSSRRVSLTRPPLASGSESYKLPPSGQNMVYYPAPVPMMLNLPPRLSRSRTTSADRPDRPSRRSQLPAAGANLCSENRKSAAIWLAGQTQDTADDSSRCKSHPTAIAIDQSSASAVATLESILDASALAPVTAFTDHPFAGPAGADVYNSSSRLKPIAAKQASSPSRRRKPRSSLGAMGQCQSSSATKLRKSSTPLAVQSAERLPSALGHDLREGSVLLGSRESNPALVVVNNDEDEGSAIRNSHHDLGGSLDQDTASFVDRAEGMHSETNEDDVEDEGEHEDEDEDEDEDEIEDEAEDDDEHLGHIGPPTTLLGELELRKKEQQQRRRTAALGHGLHSTLLELDAVAQKQSEHRRQRPVTLAWEAPDLRDDEAEDENVPLAMLYPEKINAVDDTRIRPLGLMEKRQLEENEPLSRRRARLKGAVLTTGPASALETSRFRRPSTMYSAAEGLWPRAERRLGSDSDDDDDDDGGGETLAQRLKHLKAAEAQKHTDGVNTAVGSDFASEIMEEVRRRSGINLDSGADAIDKSASASETKQKPDDDDETEEETLAQRRHRLQQEAKGQNRLQQPSQKPGGPRRTMTDILQSHHPDLPMAAPYYGLGTVSANGSPHYGNGALAINAMNMAYGLSAGLGGVKGLTGQSIDPGQREMIDRWRQSIL